MLPVLEARGGSSPMMARLVMDLPEPDSPTIPTVWFASTLRLIP